MTIYEFSLILGFLGLAIMAIAGQLGPKGGHDNDVSNVALPGHGAHGAHGGGHDAAGAASGPGSLPALAARGGGRGGLVRASARGVRGARAGGNVGTRLLAWLSPRVMFSVLVGFGAAGLALHRLLGEPWSALLAAAVGVLFEALIVGPVWRFVMSFGSSPARTLDHHLLAEARAETGFDANGQGLISMEVDGQVVQVLGTLRREERDARVRVRAGDRLIVEDVDTARNRCTVSRHHGLSSGEARSSL